MTPDLERAKTYIFDRLGHELSSQLTYHSLYHTRDDVLPAAIRLGQKSGLDDLSLLLLATAALYHDTGFIYHYHNHVDESIAIAQATLPKFGYDTEQIRHIAGMIAATKMPQRPRTKLEELLCDADLDLLGREDFLRLNHNLLIETRRYIEPTLTEEKWLKEQCDFLADHSYFSGAAHTLRDEGKILNLARMRQALFSLNGDEHAVHNNM
jgi:uncharacterized protein